MLAMSGNETNDCALFPRGNKANIKNINVPKKLRDPTANKNQKK